MVCVLCGCPQQSVTRVFVLLCGRLETQLESQQTLHVSKLSALSHLRSLSAH